MAVCPSGHVNADGARYCSECGAAMSGTSPESAPRPAQASTVDRIERPPRTATPGSDLGIVLAVALGLAFVALFVAGLVGTGEANSRGQFDTFAYLAGLGAAPWAI